MGSIVACARYVAGQKNEHGLWPSPANYGQSLLSIESRAATVRKHNIKLDSIK